MVVLLVLVLVLVLLLLVLLLVLLLHHSYHSYHSYHGYQLSTCRLSPHTKSSCFTSFSCSAPEPSSSSSSKQRCSSAFEDETKSTRTWGAWGCSLDAWGCSLDAWGCSLDAWGCSLDPWGCSLNVQGCSLDAWGCGRGGEEHAHHQVDRGRLVSLTSHAMRDAADALHLRGRELRAHLRGGCGGGEEWGGVSEGGGEEVGEEW